MPAWKHAGKFFVLIELLTKGMKARRWPKLVVLSGVLLASAMVQAQTRDELRTRPANSISARLDSFVNWDYRHRKKLKGWQTTAFVIQRTLSEWYPAGHSSALLVENQPAVELPKFLSALPTRRDCHFSLVYLASHQSPAGEWDFTQRRIELLCDLVAQAQPAEHPQRIVILDACFAAAVQREPKWTAAFPGVCLFSSLPSEVTPELNFRDRQPVDLSRRYPATAAWLRESLGEKWDGRISFLGFVWTQCFLATKTPPNEVADWIRFAKQCEAFAAEFRKNVSRRCSSTLVISEAGETL